MDPWGAVERVRLQGMWSTVHRRVAESEQEALPHGLGGLPM